MTQSKAAFIRAHKATIEEANRRIAELKAAGENTPALEILSDWTKGQRRVRFNKNLDIDTLRQSLSYAKAFIKSKSSTVAGMAEIRVTHDIQLGEIVREYGQAGLAANTADVYRVLGSVQWRRAQGTLDSNVMIAYVNREIASGKKAATVKGNLTKILQDVGKKNVDDPNLYMRERWKI